MDNALDDNQTYPAILRLLAEENRRLRTITEELGSTAERLNQELRAARLESAGHVAGTADAERR